MADGRFIATSLIRAWHLAESESPLISTQQSPSSYAERPLLAESGSQNLVIPAFLTSALPPKAAIGLIRC